MVFFLWFIVIFNSFALFSMEDFKLKMFSKKNADCSILFNEAISSKIEKRTNKIEKRIDFLEKKEALLEKRRILLKKEDTAFEDHWGSLQACDLQGQTDIVYLTKKIDNLKKEDFYTEKGFQEKHLSLLRERNTLLEKNNSLRHQTQSFMEDHHLFMEQRNSFMREDYLPNKRLLNKMRKFLLKMEKLSLERSVGASYSDIEEAAKCGFKLYTKIREDKNK